MEGIFIFKETKFKNFRLYYICEPIFMQIMKIRLLCFVFLITIQIGFTQNNFLWQGYFSYNNIRDVSDSPTAIFAASENALFSKNITTNLLKTTNTIDGLSGQTISTLYYSPTSNKTLVGYENGLIIVINEADGSIINVVDILNKQIPANIKKINHFMEHDGIAYVSCDFGIVQFNLSTLQFGDTYFIGDNGTETSVTQTTVFGGYIYATTNNGIKRADIINKNLIDYNQWVRNATGSWTSIEAFGAELIAVSATGYIHKYNSASNSFIEYLQLPQAAVDMRARDNYLIVTTASSVNIYNKQMAIVRQINSSQITESNPSFNCATSIGDIIYIGTKENGMLNTTISISSAFEISLS